MTEVSYVSRKELTTAEIIDRVENGGRVVIEVSVLGSEKQIVIRKDGGVYYCDTALKLLTHDTPEELRHCLERFRLSEPDSAQEPEAATVMA